MFERALEGEKLDSKLQKLFPAQGSLKGTVQNVRLFGQKSVSLEEQLCSE